jgi:hypothetical protein
MPAPNLSGLLNSIISFSYFIGDHVLFSSFHRQEAMNEDDKTKEDSLLTRRELTRRWKVSIETLKRRERTKILRPMRLDGRIVVIG